MSQMNSKHTKHQVLQGTGEGVTTTFLDILISWHPDKSIGHCTHRKVTHTDTYKQSLTTYRLVRYVIATLTDKRERQREGKNKWWIKPSLWILTCQNHPSSQCLLIPRTSTLQPSPDPSTTKAVKDIIQHITFMSNAYTTSRNQSTKQCSASNPSQTEHPLRRQACKIPCSCSEVHIGQNVHLISTRQTRHTKL